MLRLPNYSNARALLHDPSGTRRYIALDSLRGVAALIVVLSHFGIFWTPDTHRKLPKIWSMLLVLLSPLSTGAEAVLVFFVLSGFVLSLPYLLGKQQPYPRYLVRRIVRICGPYWAALLLAVLCAALWHNHPYHNQWTSDMWSQPIQPVLVLQHILLIGVFNTDQYDFVIWSLVHEMRISIIFPALCAFVIRSTVRWTLAVASFAFCVPLLLPVHAPESVMSFAYTIHYCAFFLIGICMAKNLQRLEHWWQHLGRRTRLLWSGMIFLSFGYALFATGLLVRFHHVHTLRAYTLTCDLLGSLGAAGVIVVALSSKVAKAVLHRPTPRFLGRISFSLYLLHPIVLLAIGFSFLNSLPLIAEFFLYMTAAFLAATVFWKIVEERSIRLSRMV